MKNKLKVLMCSEASFLSSGFGTYAKEILSRLYKTQKYEIAEFASYGIVNDPRDKDIPWTYYANAVRDNDPRYSEYMSRPDNQFGKWRFEKVLLDFKPDVVIDVRDYWMTAYQAMSPLRSFFHWILMPTVDSAPQQEEWLQTFLSADSIFTYSDWGADVLKQQTSGKVRYIETASPGVDLQTFKIIEDNKKLKVKLGLKEDAVIIGSVMRNQKRKLIPELLVVFRNLLDHLEKNNPELAKKIVLYLHTSYPDAGWELPEILKDNRVANKVFFTYSCRKCGDIKANLFQGPSKVCGKCLEKTVTLTSVTNGIPSSELANIYNVFDIYIQYSICEGFGMPQVEAAACGVPIFTVNYSAMVDIVKKLEATPIPPAVMFKELETKAYRSYPDNNELVKQIINYLNQDDITKKNKRLKTRELTELHYNWDDIAKKWENHLDIIDQNYRSNWNAPPKYIMDNKNIGNDENHDSFSRTLNICTDTLNDRQRAIGMNFLGMLQNADYGFVMQGMNVHPASYNNVIENIKILINNNNQSENVRTNNVKFNDDFIQYAHIKNNTK